MRQLVLCQPREHQALRTEVMSMREKMWQAQQDISGENIRLCNLKKDHGGITDIEFIVQYLILANSHHYPELIRWSDNIRQLESLRQHGLLSNTQENELATTYRTLRNQIHALALQEQKAIVPATKFKQERAVVRRYWADSVSYTHLTLPTKA